MAYDIKTQAALIRQHIGYMTQKFSYWEDLSIRENLEFVSSIFGADKIAMRVKQSLLDSGLARGKAS